MVVEKTIGNTVIVYYSAVPDSVTLLHSLALAPLIPGEGRSGIKLIEIGGRRLVARKYTHGGLFRMISGDLFTDRSRATREAEIMNYLRERGFPAVEPFCAIAERRNFGWRLHLVTVLQENAVDLLRESQSSSRKERLRTARGLGRALWDLVRAGVYHPDLHLRNVLVTQERSLVFLDFDRATRKAISERDLRSMFGRLNRFVEKMEKHGYLRVTNLEKALFVRTYARLSGVDMTKELAAPSFTSHVISRIGWAVESVLYKKG
jgi:3-deoxy-D-manno-octulosonic acid kinase